KNRDRLYCWWNGRPSRDVVSGAGASRGLSWSLRGYHRPDDTRTMAFALGHRVHIHADDHFAGWLFGGRDVVQRLAAISITATILSNLGWSTVTLRSEVFAIADFALNITSANDDVKSIASHLRHRFAEAQPMGVPAAIRLGLAAR